jgi:CheY-like chemotaxis protein
MGHTGGRLHGGTQTSKHRVLVIDDDRALADVVAESLEHVDDELEVVSTTEPERALTRLERDGFDCLITDYEMPGVDGLALAAADDTDTPFIVFTNRREGDIAADARERGGKYLRKRTGSDQYHRLAAMVHEQATDD